MQRKQEHSTCSSVCGSATGSKECCPAPLSHWPPPPLLQPMKKQRFNGNAEPGRSRSPKGAHLPFGHSSKACEKGEHNKWRTAKPRLMLLYWKWPWSIRTAAGCSRAAKSIHARCSTVASLKNTRRHARTAGMNTASHSHCFSTHFKSLKNLSLRI